MDGATMGGGEGWGGSRGALAAEVPTATPRPPLEVVPVDALPAEAVPVAAKLVAARPTEGGPAKRRQAVLVRVEVTDGLALITLTAAPANALTRPVLRTLLAALGHVAADPCVTAVALAAEGTTFSAGVDVRDVDAAPGRGPDLAAVCDAIEACALPTVALLDGPALGAGAELALAAGWRLGTGRARMAFPDLALGLPPGGGGTQRLPRLVGAGPALDLLLSRRVVGAEEMRRLGLLDGVVSGEPVAAARAFLDEVARRGSPASHLGHRRGPLPDGRSALRAAARARASLRPAQVAERDVVDCVEAALLLPFAQGLAFEAERRADALARPEAQALRHLALVERRVPPTLLRRLPGGACEVAEAGEALVERLGRAMGRAAGALVRGGASRAQVDAALVDWGLPAGPFGSAAGGAEPGGPALVRRINGAVAAEGARLVAEGLAAPGDVDALAVAGLGVPRESGGPMAMAEAQGLAALCRDMEAWATEDPVWAVPPLLAEAGRSGALARPA